MKNILIIILTTVLLVSCQKDEPIEHELNKSNFIDNNLITNEGDISFQRLIGGEKLDALYSVKQTTDKGFIACGFTSNDTASERDIFVLKTNIYGETDWIKLFSESYTDQGWDIELTEDDNYIIAATSNLQSSSQYEPIPYCGQLLKINNSGSQIWKRSFVFGDFTHFSSVRQTYDKGYIAVGTEFSSKRAIVLKTDVNGDEQWRKSFSIKTEFNYIENVTDGGFIICGIDYSNSMKQRDIYIVKIDNHGDTIWTKTIGDNYDNTPTTIKPTISGFLMCGYNTNTPVGASGFITTLDKNGNLIWTKDYDSNNIQAFDDIIITKDNEFASIGRESFGSISMCYLVKVKSDNGDIIWQKEFNLGEYNSLSELKMTSDNGFIMAGYSLNSGNGNGYLIKTDEEGN